MKYCEIKLNKLFTLYSQKYKEDFLKLYDNDSEDKLLLLDIQFYSLYSQKELSPFIENIVNSFEDYPDKIVDIIHSKFNKLYELKTSLSENKIEYVFNRQEKTIEKISQTGNTITENNSIDEENSYSFDSDVPQKDNSRNGQDNENIEHKNTSDRELTKTYLENPIQNRREFIGYKLNEQDFINLTFKVYNDILFLSIYN